MNFGTLKSSILANIGRAPADVCYELVTADINQQLRLKEMESTTTLTEAATVALPSDFLQVIDIYRDVDPRTYLSPTTISEISRRHDSSGTPREFAVVDGNLLLNPSPSGSESLQLRYYAKLSDLSADGDENDILTNFPAVYIYGALSHHGAIRSDPRTQTWVAAYELAKDQAKAATNKARTGGPTAKVYTRSAP